MDPSSVRGIFGDDKHKINTDFFGSSCNAMARRAEFGQEDFGQNLEKICATDIARQYSHILLHWEGMGLTIKAKVLACTNS